MTKKELVEALSLHTDIVDGTKAGAGRVIEFIFETITEEMKKGNSVDVSGFGSFSTAMQQGKTGLVPGTNNPYSSPDKMVPKFKAAAALKRNIAGK